MKNEINEILELLEQEYLNTRTKEEKEELREVFKNIEEEAKDFAWLF